MNSELIGKKITLTPIDDVHFEALQTIVLANPNVYRYTTIGCTQADFARWFVKAQADKAWTVVRLSDNQPVGSTRLYNINQAVRVANVGYTWYATDCRGTGVNDASKLLLLTHAFEALALNRMVFEIHADNISSRKAVEKMGAQLEGVMRESRQTIDGKMGDTAIYALLASDWSKTKQQLQKKVESR